MSRSHVLPLFAGRALCAWLLFLPLWLMGDPAHAISISKTSLEIDAASLIKKRETFITVSNEKNVPVFVSSTIQGWKVLPDGKFELSPTDEVRVSPGVVNLPPNGSATLRLSYQGDSDRPNQMGYRLQLKESPRLNIREISEGVGANLMLTANMTLPVFVTPKGPLSDAFEKVSVKWRLGDKTDEGTTRIFLEVTNAGNRYVMAQNLELGGKTVSTPAQYVLPGDTVTVATVPIDAAMNIPEDARMQVMLRYLDRTTVIDAIRDLKVKHVPLPARRTE